MLPTSADMSLIIMLLLHTDCKIFMETMWFGSRH